MEPQRVQTLQKRRGECIYTFRETIISVHRNITRPCTMYTRFKRQYDHLFELDADSVVMCTGVASLYRPNVSLGSHSWNAKNIL